MTNIISQWAKIYLINEGIEDQTLVNPDDHDTEIKADQYEDWVKEYVKILGQLKQRNLKEGCAEQSKSEDDYKEETSREHV